MDLGMYIYLLALIVIFPAIAGSIAVLIYGGTLKFIAPLLAFLTADIADPLLYCPVCAFFILLPQGGRSSIF